MPYQLDKISCFIVTLFMCQIAFSDVTEIGLEKTHSYRITSPEVLATNPVEMAEFGKTLFSANFTSQDGAGRPLAKGTGPFLSDMEHPLVFPRNFNRVSGPDANSCAGCHNAPFGIPGGAGDIVGNVFVLGQRFDFATLDPADTVPTRGSVDELKRFMNLNTIGNSRATPGMFGSGYIEMLARQITANLQAIRKTIKPGESKALASKGISFGILSRDAAGNWNTDKVEGLSYPSLLTSDHQEPPSLVMRPFHQNGALMSLRVFTNNAFNQHHGMQSDERFGTGMDRDGDGVAGELTWGDITAVAVYQATMAVPGRVIPDVPEIEKAVWEGERKFSEIGCAACHIPRLPLVADGHLFTEPGPYNPLGNLILDSVKQVYSVDLNNKDFPLPRLKADHDTTWVPAYTDLKLHDITSGPDDPNREPVDMLRPPGSPEFLAGNGRFLTKKLWGCANAPAHFHHGLFTTLRESVLAHSGEALASRRAFETLDTYERACVIEFLKSLQVLPPGTKHLVVNEKFKKKNWPPRHAEAAESRTAASGARAGEGFWARLRSGWKRGVHGISGSP